MSKADKFAIAHIEKAGYRAWSPISGQLQIVSTKPHAMRVYATVRIGSVFRNKLQIKILNLTNSSDYKEIFDKFDGVVLQYEKESYNPVVDVSEPDHAALVVDGPHLINNVLTQDVNQSIMVASVDECDGTLDSLFA